MENFKEIAEKCLAGELSGRFVCRDGLQISSFTLSRTDYLSYPYKLYRVGKLTIDGFTSSKYSHNDIIQFIPYEEMKPEQIKIDIPEGKVPVMKQTENEVVITWKEKEYSYNDIVEILQKDLYNNYIENLLSLGGFITTMSSDSSDTTIFYKKVEALRKLTNIRNYFGKPDPKEVLSVGWCISSNLSVTSAMPAGFGNVVFLKKEHAEQAIKMLGDELKYLFEPW